MTFGVSLMTAAAMVSATTQAMAQEPLYLRCEFTQIDQGPQIYTQIYRIASERIRVWLRDRWQEPLDNCDPPDPDTDEMRRAFIAGTTCAFAVNENEISGSAATTVGEIVARDRFSINRQTGAFTRTAFWDGAEGHYTGACRLTADPETTPD